MSEEKPKGYLARYGAALIANGYDIIPIRQGAKAPPMDDWQKIRATLNDVRKWTEGDDAPYRRAGVGIQTRLTPGVDIDSLDAKCAAHMRRWIEENIGFAPVRLGFAPKALMLFRADTPFRKINSTTYMDDVFGDPELTHSGSGKPTGHLRKIEILGDGQQFVAYHRHPDTKKPYEWVTKETPLTVKAEDLDTLTYEQGLAIVAEFDRYAKEAGWKVAPKAATARAGLPARTQPVGKVATDDVFASDKPKATVTFDELQRHLLLVPGSSDYDRWFQVGMALWHQFDGEQVGLELWHLWSQTAENYDPAALDAKWETFDAEGKGREPLTARFIIKLAREYQESLSKEIYQDIKSQLKAADTLDALRAVCATIKKTEFDNFIRAEIVGTLQKQFREITKSNLTVGAARDMVRFENTVAVHDTPNWLKGYVYVTAEAGFYSTKTRSFMKTEAFNAAFGRFMLTQKDVLEGLSNPETLPSAFALNNKQIPVVDHRMYIPGEDDLFSYNGQPCVNTYSDGNIPDIPSMLSAADKKAIQTVKDHVANLFENEKDRNVLIDVMAYIVQNPGQRVNWAILLQGAEGDGKTFFSAVLGAVLGADNVSNIGATAMEEKYNSWATGAQVVFAEELKMHGHNRYDVLNKLKPMITNVVIPIRRMQTDWFTVPNTATFFFATNFKDALPLDENDTRYYPIFSRFQTREDLKAFKAAHPGYMKRLHKTLEHAGALRRWLMEHKIAEDFDPKERAPESAARAEMISYSLSPEMRTLREILAAGSRPDLSIYLLSTSALAKEFSDRGEDAPYGMALNRLLLNAGFTGLGKVRVGKETNYYWSRRPGSFRDIHGKTLNDKIRAWVEDDI